MATEDLIVAKNRLQSVFNRRKFDSLLSLPSACLDRRIKNDMNVNCQKFLPFEAAACKSVSK